MWLVDQIAERSQHLLDRLATGVERAIVEIRRMQRAHIDWQARAIKAHGHQNAAISRFARLTTHPTGLNRLRAPDDQNGSGGPELGSDLPVEFLTGHDFRVPPNRPTPLLDRGHERRNARLVASGIGYEDVGHFDRTSTSMGRLGTPEYRRRY